MLRKILNRYPALKTVGRELLYRPSWYKDSHDELEQLFRWSDDPWNFESSQYEQDRLQFLSEIVKRYSHETILEVGCAEGVFTERLYGLSKQVVAIDVSPTALARAKQRCPEVMFFQKSLQEFSWTHKFDMVVCSETLYYIKDVAEAIDKLTSLGKYCMVSYVHRETKNLDPYFFQMPLVAYERFEKSYWLWNHAMSVAVWENNGSPFYFKNLNGHG